jgi:hypothetical protein
MAVATTSYFSNSIVGQPQLGADIDLFDTTANPKYAVGFGFSRADGNKYRYCHFGALTAVGQVVSKLSGETNLTKIVNVGATVGNNTDRASDAINPNWQGARYMQLVITASASQFEGGYITVANGSGSGYTYRIKGHTTTSDGTPVTGNIYMDLYEPIQSPLDSNSDIIIAGSSYADLFPANTGTSGAGAIVGVSVQNQSAANYGWICTGGTIGVLQDAGIGTYGQAVSLSSNTVGAIRASGLLTGANLTSIGYIMEQGSSADYSLVNLTIE